MGKVKKEPRIYFQAASMSSGLDISPNPTAVITISIDLRVDPKVVKKYANEKISIVELNKIIRNRL